MRAFKRVRVIAQEAKAIIDNFEDDAVIVDIGSDHGYIAEQIVRMPKAKKVIATDISPKCLDKVSKLKDDCGYTKLETRLGDGLNAIDKADLCIIAGIGGNEIQKMLEKQNLTPNGNKCNKFILQPSEDVIMLRKWLYKNAFVEKDYVFECAKRFYSLIVVSLDITKRKKMSKFAKFFGNDTNKNSIDFKNYLCYIRKNLNFVETLNVEQVKQKKCKETIELYEYAKLILEQIGGRNVR